MAINRNYKDSLFRKVFAEKKDLLSDYSKFVEKMKEAKKAGLDTETAALKTVSWCIENDILKDLCIKDKSEVLETLIFEYDEERHIKNEKAISFEEGQMQNMIRIATNMINDGSFSSEQISKLTGLAIEKIDELVFDTEEDVKK